MSTVTVIRNKKYHLKKHKHIYSITEEVPGISFCGIYTSTTLYGGKHTSKEELTAVSHNPQNII